MEKVFGTVFWDYSNKPLNLHGRICLEFAIYWGFLGLLLIYVLDTTTAASWRVGPDQRRSTCLTRSWC